MNGFGLKRLEELTLKKDSKPEEICLAIDCIFKLLRFYIFTQDFKLQCASTLLRVSESFSHDSDVIMKCFQVFSFLLHCERMKRNKHKAVRFFLAGETATIQNVFQLHQEQSAEVRVIGKEILNDLQFFSADAALLKIEKVKQSSDLGITVKIFQQVQSSCSNKNSPKGIVTGEETDDVALVLAEMNRYPSHEGIQQKGLEVVASLLESTALASLTTNTKLIMSIVDIVISSIASKHSELQRLGLSILLILTKDMYICNKFARKGACRTLVQQLISREIYQEYRQTAIWSLSYLCNEGKKALFSKFDAKATCID